MADWQDERLFREMVCIGFSDAYLQCDYCNRLTTSYGYSIISETKLANNF